MYLITNKRLNEIYMRQGSTINANLNTHQVSKQVKYYNRLEKSVTTGTLMGKILNEFNFTHVTNWTNLDQVIDATFRSIRNMGLVDKNTRGTKLKKFLNHHADVYCLSLDEPYLTYNRKDDWEEMYPLNVIGVDNPTLALNHPDDYYKFDYGDIMYSLDIRALLVQYYHWLKYRESHNMSIDKEVFIYQYPLTNSMISMFNISLLHRYIYNEDLTFDDLEPTFISMIKTADIRKGISFFNKETIKRRMFYTDMMNSIPYVFGWNINMLLKDISPIYNNKWLLYKTVLPLLKPIFKYDDHFFSFNIHELKTFKVKLEIDMRDNIHKVAPKEVQKRLMDDMEYTLSELSRRY